VSDIKFDCVYFGDGFYVEYVTKLWTCLFGKKKRITFSDIWPTNWKM